MTSSAETPADADENRPVPWHTVWRSLPGRAIAGAALVNGQLWLILDPDKVMNIWHARHMIDWLGLGI